MGVAGYTPAPGERPRTLLNRVSPTYFETVGTRLLDGRGFDARDTPTAPPVAVVNEEFVRRFSRGRRPIGGRFGIGNNEECRNDIEIVGVVENAKYEDPWERPQPMAFLPLLQPYPGEAATGGTASSFIGTIEIRAAGDPLAAAAGTRRARSRDRSASTRPADGDHHAGRRPRVEP